ncbi:MAG: beta-N-acetylglucosaminidase domain-containing protein [Bacteroidota bacterium]
MSSSPTASKSPFQYHGVVEGFYGEPWSHDQRLEMIRFMGEAGFNTFFYAPKDDPYHRSKWRDPYPPDDLRRFRELFVEARRNRLAFYYAISPGLSIAYSSDTDYEMLIAKIDAMMEQGVRHFALFVDDVPEELAHEADRARFPKLGEAHVFLINRLHPDLTERGADLVVCPTTYTDSFGDRDYVAVLGSGIDPEIPLFWTGTDVAVERITAEEAENWGQLMRRRPLIWDNFPVNDYDTWRPFVGPLRGRDPKLATATRGIIANPMVEPYLSMVPLHTVAAYASDPDGYDPDSAWLEALNELYGAEAAEILEPVLHLYDDFGWDSNLFRPLYAPGEPIHLGEIDAAMKLMREAQSRLRTEGFATNVRLQGGLDEIESFRRKTAERLTMLMSTPGYHTGAAEDGGRLLLYDENIDLYTSTHTKKTDTDDRAMCDWTDASFHPLQGRGAVRAAFQHDEGRLYIAVDVRDDDLRPGPEGAIHEGDHVAIAIDYNPMDPECFMTPGDVFIQLAAPDPITAEAPAALTTMAFTEHAARGARDHQRPRLNLYYKFFAVQPEARFRARFEAVRFAVRRTESGYFAEVAVPREGDDRMRLDIGYYDVDEVDGRRVEADGTLSRRGYLFNPKSYATVVMG